MSNKKIIITYCFGWLVLMITLVSFIAALLDTFYAILIVGVVILLSGYIYKRISSQKLINFKSVFWSKQGLIMLFLSLGIMIYMAQFFSINYLGGRDPGAMVEAGIELANNNSLLNIHETADAFDNQDSNQLALNYPGFIFTAQGLLKTQFNLGYVVILGFWYDLLGELGLKLANAGGLLLGLFSFYLLGLKLAKNRLAAFMATALLATSFPFIWFSRQNYTEVYAFGFLMFFLLNFIQLTRKPLAEKTKHGSAVATINFYLATLSLLAFVLIRIEGIYLIILTVFVVYLKKMQGQLHLNLNQRKKYFLIAVGSIFLIYSLTISPLYKKLFKDLIGYEASNSQVQQIKEKQAGLLNKTWATQRTLWHYRITPGLLLGLGGVGIIMLGFWQKNKNKTGKKFLTWIKNLKLNSSAILFLFLSPYLILLFKPLITLDHPWMLRRFMFSLWPLLILGIFPALITLRKKFKLKKQKNLFLGLVFLVLILIQGDLLIRYAIKQENPGIKKQILELGDEFGSDELLLVDKSCGFNDWSLISEPLRYLANKNAVYIFNPQDLSKIKKYQYKKVWLLTAGDPGPYQDYLQRLSGSFTWNLYFEQLPAQKADAQPLRLPEIQKQTKQIKVYPVNLLKQGDEPK
ncbi:MAG: hypothetical protein GF332_00745 [Candidatus Moranbacteria bacterium]|nr:hypothetical protein [Candidatus Moranbacteria bacterium]